jgi:hypothetical protein
MAVNKVEYAGKVLLDLTSDTVSASNMFDGVTAHDKSGTGITGTIKKQELTVTPSDSVQTFQEDNTVYSSVTVEAAEAVESEFPPGFWDQSTYSDGITIDIPEGVKKLRSYIFYDYYKGLKVTLPSTLQEIGNYTFAGATGLKEINFYEGLTKLGNYCFRNTCLKYLILPSTVTSIGQNCFNKCTYLTYIKCLATKPPTLQSSYPPFGDTNDCPIYVPDDSVSSYQSSWSTYKDRIKALSEFTE